MQLAGCTANYIFLHNCILVNLLVQQLVLNIIEAKAIDGVCKTLAGDTFFAEEQDGAFYHLDDLFFAGEDLIQRAAFCNLLAPASADVDLVAVGGIVDCTEGTLAYAATAVIALVGRNMDLAIHQFSNLDRAAINNLALLAAVALGHVNLGDTLSDDTEVVQAGLYAVVGTSAYCNLKFMR